MAGNASEKTMQSGSAEPAPQKTETIGLKRRIYSCFTGAPLADSLTPEAKGPAPTPLYESISLKIHPRIKIVGFSMSIYISVGSFFFYLFRHQLKGKSTNSLIDSIYVCVSTLTTVGYGDLVPDSIPTKILASALAFAGMGIVGLVLNETSDFFLEKQEKMFMKFLHLRQKLGPEEIEKEFETDIDKRLTWTKFLMLGVSVSVFVVVGIFHLLVVEEYDFIDALYWVSVTMTTLGYEDESFKHTKGRFFAIFWILGTTVSLAQGFIQVIKVKFDCRQRAFIKRVLAQRMKNLDLEAADVGDDGVVEAADFIVYKLKEMGKVSQEDISSVMKEYEGLDLSGSLSASEKKLSEPSPTEKK